MGDDMCYRKDIENAAENLVEPSCLKNFLNFLGKQFQVNKFHVHLP